MQGKETQRFMLKFEVMACQVSISLVPSIMRILTVLICQY